jgi:hypothetical protein
VTTDPALIEKREELKRRLAAGEYKTLVDVFLIWTDQLVRKLTRLSQPLPIWIVAIILILFVNLIGFAVNTIAGDWTNTIKYFELLGLKIELGILWKLWDSILAVTVLLVINGFIGRIFALWRSEVLDATESIVSLKKFEDWLEGICNRRLHFILAIVGGLFANFISGSIVSSVNVQYAFIGIGFALMQILNYIINFSSFYLFFMFIILAVGLRQYDIKLFAADPSSSELLSRLSGVLSLIVYMVAVFAAISVPVSTLIGLTTADTLVLLFLWVPIAAMFILNQSSLSSIVRRVKWKTLNEIQVKVERLRASRSFGSPKTMDTINKLMNYHDRVKATRDSALDFRTYLSFINSLLLPLLAFILGNLDLVLKLFGRNP